MKHMYSLVKGNLEGVFEEWQLICKRVLDYNYVSLWSLIYIVNSGITRICHSARIYSRRHLSNFTRLWFLLPSSLHIITRRYGLVGLWGSIERRYPVSPPSTVCMWPGMLLRTLHICKIYLLQSLLDRFLKIICII